MAFPTSPSYGDQHILGGKTFRWGGLYWSAVLLADQAPSAGGTNVFQSPVRQSYYETLVTGASTPVKNMAGALLSYL